MNRERKKPHIGLAIGILIAATACFVQAQQVPPFFGGGVVAYDPEVSTIPNGAIMDAQATVSDDRKYVTLNMRGANSKLQSLQNYPVSTVLPQGFVGGVNFPVAAGAAVATPNTATRGGAGGARSALMNPSPEQIQREARAWILVRQGMYLVKPLP